MSEAEYCDPLDKNDYLLSNIAQFSVFFSLLGSLFVILVYTCFKSSRNFAYKLILQISISDLIYCTSHFLREKSRFHLGLEAGALCTTQGFLVNFGTMSSFMWAFIVAWALYYTVVLQRFDLQKKFKELAYYGYGVPFLMSLIPLLTGDYAPVGYRCWITLEHNSARGEALRFLLLYVPLWAIVCFNSVSYYKVKKFLDQYMASGPERSFVRRLRAYPLILGLCWFGATVHSIYILFHCEKRYNFFDALSVGMSGLTGYFNAIAYGMNHHVQSALVRKFPFLLRFAQSCKGISCCYWASEHEKEFHETLDDLENLDTTKSCQGVELSILSNHRHLLSEVRTEGR